MKSKHQSTFSTQFANIVAKLKDASTVQVGHEQAKSLMCDTSLKDMINPFLSKMDTSNGLTEREKKQYSKLYITLIDTYKQQLLSHAYYERLIESLLKKTIGVADVVAHICKALLSRIQPMENIYDYAHHLLEVFRSHVEVARIYKQIIEHIHPSIMSNQQHFIISLIHQKVNTAKNKSQFLDCLLTLTLTLEDNLDCETEMIIILQKSLKSEDFNARKVSVDICYALLVIRKDIHQHLHTILKELKYDKIKFVRDAICNYQMLYKQIFGDVKKQVQKYANKQQRYANKQQKYGNRQQRYGNRQVQRQKIKPSQRVMPNRENIPVRANTQINKSPNDTNLKDKSPNSKNINKNIQKDIKTDKSLSQERSSLSKQRRNQTFFKNATNRDDIKVNQQNKSFIQLMNQDIEINTIPKEDIAQSMYLPKSKFQLTENHTHKNNFEAYLKNKSSPKNNHKDPNKMEKQIHSNTISEKKIISSNIFQQNKHTLYESKLDTENKNIKTFEIEKAQSKAANYTNLLEKQNQNNIFKKKTQRNQQMISPDEKHKEQRKYFNNNNNIWPLNDSVLQHSNNNHEFSLSVIQNKKQQNSHDKIEMLKDMMKNLQNRLYQKIGRLEQRIDALQLENAALQSFKITSEGQTSKQSYNKQINHRKNGKKLAESQLQYSSQSQSQCQQPQQQLSKFQQQQLSEEHIYIRSSGGQSPKREDVSYGQSPKGEDVCYGQSPKGEDVSQYEAIESNFQQKLKCSIKNQNWDEAYTIILANNQTSLLLELLEKCLLPKDSTVQECLLLQIRKMLHHPSTLKWLKSFLLVKRLHHKKIDRFVSELQSENCTRNCSNRSYEMLRKVVLNQLMMHDSEEGQNL